MLTDRVLPIQTASSRQPQKQHERIHYHIVEEMERKRPFEETDGEEATGCGSVSGLFGGVANLEHSDTEGDMLLAKELSQLSMEQRELVMEEVHCLPKAINESPEFVEESLRHLEEEILKIRKRSAYEKALFISPDHIRDRDFRLMFLISVFFVPRKAARRMVNHFHQKLRLFRFDKLVKPIPLDDLEPDDIAAMASGCLQILPEKDQAGRTIVVGFHEKHCYKTFKNHVRNR